MFRGMGWTITLIGFLVFVLLSIALTTTKPTHAQTPVNKEYSFEIEWYTQTAYATLWSLPEQTVTTTVFSTDVVSDFASLADSNDGIRVPYPNVSFPYEPKEFWFTEESGRMGGSRHSSKVCPEAPFINVGRYTNGKTQVQIFNLTGKPFFVEDDQGQWHIIEHGKSYFYVTMDKIGSIAIKASPYITAPECASVWFFWDVKPFSVAIDAPYDVLFDGHPFTTTITIKNLTKNSYPFTATVWYGGTALEWRTETWTPTVSSETELGSFNCREEVLGCEREWKGTIAANSTVTFTQPLESGFALGEYRYLEIQVISPTFFVEMQTITLTMGTQVPVTQTNPFILGITPPNEAAISETVIITGIKFVDEDALPSDHQIMLGLEDTEGDLLILTDRTKALVWTSERIEFIVPPSYEGLEGQLCVRIETRMSNCRFYQFYKDETDPVPHPDNYLFIPVAFSK